MRAAQQGAPFRTAAVLDSSADGEAPWSCHNTLSVTSASATEVEFRETPQNSRGSQGFCVGGTMTLKKAADGLAYTSPGSLGSTTEGALRRSG